MLDPALDVTTRERAMAGHTDWRNAWAGADAAGQVCAWPPDAAATLGVLALEPGPWLRLTTVLEPMRREPRHASEMISELIGGESVRGLLRRDQWWLVHGADGYVGWVHQWVLAECAAPALRPPAFRYGLPHGTLWVSDHVAARPLWRGLPLYPVQGPVRPGFELLQAPTGEEGWLTAAELVDPAPLADARALLNLVQSLVGVPYRWGGRSPLGFDCSGLVQFAAQLCGVGLPRDAAQQAGCGDAVDPDPATWRVGDLLCFGAPADHVAFYDGSGGLLHCQGRVRRDQWDGHALQSRLSGVRRWWGLRGS